MPPARHERREENGLGWTDGGGSATKRKPGGPIRAIAAFLGGGIRQRHKQTNTNSEGKGGKSGKFPHIRLPPSLFRSGGWRGETSPKEYVDHISSFFLFHPPPPTPPPSQDVVYYCTMYVAFRFGIVFSNLSVPVDFRTFPTSKDSKFPF